MGERLFSRSACRAGTDFGNAVLRILPHDQTLRGRAKIEANDPLQMLAPRWTPCPVNHKLPLIQLFRESGLHDRDTENRGNSGGRCSRYSRLTGTDEDRTLARLRALRSDLIDPTIAVHSGRVVKRTGDGALVEFRSVVDAVRCAIEVQNGMVERNGGLPPERRIEFRVGIHLGDVVEESDGDLMGDGVNIAARLEGIAKPGAICLSEDAFRQVKGRLDLAVTDLGPTQLKNIARPVRVYSVEVGKPVSLKPAKAAKRN